MSPKHICRNAPLRARCGNFFVPLLAWIALMQLFVVADPVDHSSSIAGRSSLNETNSNNVDKTKDLANMSIEGKVREQWPEPLKDLVGLFPQSRRDKARLSTELAKQDEVQGPVLEEKIIQPLEYREPKNSASLVQRMQDQIELAKMLVNFVKINSHHRLLRDLKSQIRENEQVLRRSRIDADLPKSAPEKMRALDRLLERARDHRNKCEALVKKLRSLVLTNEEKIQVLKEEGNFLRRLAARTIPKGLHCLALQLTIKYYNQPNNLPVPADGIKLEVPELYHYAIFSENILAASVVVNSTIFHVKEPHKHVFHILTDGLNYAAMKMWFWANTPGGALVEVKNLDDFHFLQLHSPLFSKLARRHFWPSLSKLHLESIKMHHKQSEKFGHMDQLHLYLVHIFPNLDKILLLDDDIVVRKDLTGLWRENLMGKVSGAVTSCRANNLLPEVILNRPNSNARVWRYCIHIFDLKELKRQNITEIIKSRLLLNQAKSVAGTVSPGLIMVHNDTHTLDNFWNVLNLDDMADAKQDEFQTAAAIHYGGYAKPWLEMNGKSYKSFWTRFVNYDNPLLQECNINV